MTTSQWLEAALDHCPPFSFHYDSISSTKFLHQWPSNHTRAQQADGTVQHVVLRTDPKTGLECELTMTEYPDSSAVEWLVRFRNSGQSNTPILSKIQALDWQQEHPADTRIILHYSKGTMGAMDDYALQQKDIDPGAEIKMVEDNDGSSRIHLPFFNLAAGNEGVLIGLGWTGNWACTFARNTQGTTTVQAGMAETYLTLHPGEEIRTPRVLLLFWQGDRQQSHNLLRRHLVAHHLPRPNGHEAIPPIACLTWGGMKTHKHLKMIEYIRQHGLKFDYYWIDAGWFGPDHDTEEFQNVYTNDWAYQAGHWRVNRNVHPDGLKPIADAVHAAGMKLLVWFGPYIAREDSPIVREHPEWIIKRSYIGKNGFGNGTPPVTHYEINYGLPAARKYVTDIFSGLIRDQGIDCFRDDCGVPFDTDESPDRRGISEIQCVTAFYAFWDDLHQRHPGLLIDNCSGGGSRIDLETIGRSLVMWRSDYNCAPDADPIASQVGTHGLSHWVPWIGGAPPARPGNTYNFRSSWSGGIPFGLFHPVGFGTGPTEPAADYPIEWHRTMIEQYQRARDFYKGDFYPLTDCTVSPRDWFAYQMDRPDLGEGLVMALRRQESLITTMELKLQGLDPTADYEFENVDTGERARRRGTSLTVILPNTPDSAVLFYKRLTD